MEIFVSAGDRSSDLHTAAAIAEMKKIDPSVTAFGLGGDALAGQGAELIMHSREFSVGGGPLEVISRLPKRSRLEHLLEERLYTKRPAGALLVDNGEINLRLAAILNFFRVPVVYYIPPKIWVWRFSRIEKIAQHVKLVLSILPFEKPIYDEWEIPFQYVGNPLLDEVPVHLTPEQALKNLGLDNSRPVVAILPGSRHSEIAFHTQLFAEAAKRFAERAKTELPSEFKDPVFVVPVPPGVDFDSVKAGFEAVLPNVRLYRGQSHDCMKAARAALIKSGTSTLEAGVLGVPMVVAYQSGTMARMIFRHVIKYEDHVGLVNLFLADEKPAVAPEYILEHATVENISNELLRVYRDGKERETQLQELARTPGLLRPPAELGASPSAAVARLVLQTISKHGNECGAKSS